MGRHGENIRKRKDGRWEGRYKVFDENKYRSVYRSVYASTYDEVKEKLSRSKLGLICKETKVQKEKLADYPPNNAKNNTKNNTVILFSQAAMEWLTEIEKKRKYSTYVKYSTIYRIHLAGIISGCQFSGTSVQELQAKISDHLLKAGLSESLQKSICCVANQILDYAGRKYAINIPLLKRPSVKPKKKSIQALSKTEQARLLDGIYQKPDKYKSAVLLCLYTGLRLGELCALRWEDIDMEGMTLTVGRTVQRISVQGYPTKTILLESDPKSESSKRVIPLAAEAISFLKLLKKGQAYIFGGKKPMDPRTMQYRFKKILKEAKVEERNFHILRHTFATNCVENSMDVKILSEVLGHADVKITLNRYIHPTMDSKRKQIGMLPDFYGQICGQAA